MYSAIEEFINQTFVPESYIFSNFIGVQIRKPEHKQIIAEIISLSEKTPSEAVLVFLSAIRYLINSPYALKMLEETNTFEQFVAQNREQIIAIGIHRKVQGNAAERALPLLEILNQKLQGQKIAVIELGASFGLIGQCLLMPHEAINKKATYFDQQQKVPETYTAIEQYLGVDIDPPGREWLLACFSLPADAARASAFINDLKNHTGHKVIKASAIGFSELNEVKALCQSKYKIVVLTSFMLYQLPQAIQQQLSSEIQSFTKNCGGHWLSQEVYFGEAEGKAMFYASWDGERILKLKDDKCTDWENI